MADFLDWLDRSIVIYSSNLIIESGSTGPILDGEQE
jgi:hypothetical protein